MKAFRYFAGVVLAVTILATLSVKALASFEFIQERKGSPLIIFVHGLGGSAQSSFGNSNGSSWPMLMKDDTIKARNQRPLSDYAIATLSYPASRSDGLRIAQITRGLLDELEDRGIYDDYDEIYFIAHSLGGVIVQDLLTSSNTTSGKQLSNLTRGVFFYRNTRKGGASQCD